MHVWKMTGVAAVMLLLTTSVRAQEQPAPDQASHHFEQGVSLYREGAFRAALIEFERAYASAPNFRVLYNTGQTRLALGDYLGTIQDFERYLVDGGSAISPERRDEVEGDLAELKHRVARIAVQVRGEATGAEVYIDDVLVGVAPLPRTIPVNVGRHRIFVKGRKGQLETQVVDVAGGELKQLDIELVAPVLELAPVIETPTVRVWSRRKKIAVGLFGATGALAGGAIATGVLSRMKHEDYERGVKQVPFDGGDVQDARSRAKTFAVLTDTLAGGAVVTAAVGLGLLLSDRPTEDDVGAQVGAHVRAQRASVTFDLGPTGISARGTF